MESGTKKSKLKIIIPIVIAVTIAVIGFLNSIGALAGKATNNVYVGDSTTAISVKDIRKAYNENQAKFDEEYKGKKVRFTGTISQIRTNVLYSGTNIRIDEIHFKEGFVLKIPVSFCTKLSELNKGDKVEVTSVIQGATFGVEVYSYGTIRSNRNL